MTNHLGRQPTPREASNAATKAGKIEAVDPLPDGPWIFALHTPNGDHRTGLDKSETSQDRIPISKICSLETT
jgi:hypothetical protein